VTDMLRTAAASEVDPDAAVRVDELSIVADSGVRILDRVSLEIRPGETLGVLGESGSGKSMTALAILDLLPAGVRVSGGSIRVAGTEVVGATESVIQRVRSRSVGMVFQDPALALDPTMKIGRQITEVLWRTRGVGRSQARETAVELLRKVEISDPEQRVDVYPHEMSGGMRQRAVIAMALAGGPSLLLADEPTTAVDTTIQAKILELLQRLKDEEQLGLMLISHDLRVISNVADRVAVMYAGRIVETGPTREVLSNPRHRYTAALLESIPSIRNSRPVSPIAGVPATPSTRPSGCPFHTRCAFATEICETVVPALEAEQTPAGERWFACHHPQGIESEVRRAG
jgi:oligopeptide/dipeptide ABC transporter ATP-binding protein